LPRKVSPRRNRRWRAKHWLHVRNVRDAEPHELALGGYKVAGVTVIIAGVWLSVTVTQSMIDSCDHPGFKPFSRDALRALPISLASPLGDRHVVDGATGEALDRFAGR
jgi:hypothetical protein